MQRCLDYKTVANINAKMLLKFHVQANTLRHFYGLESVDTNFVDTSIV